MPRQAPRTDANQAQIVTALRGRGCVVQILAAVGKGVPDLLVGRDGDNWLFEVKDGKGTLTEDQTEWHRNWRGQVAVLRTLEDIKRYFPDVTEEKE